jgi:CheY-like chemotaxis protein
VARVLVVDDDEVVREVVLAHLRRAGHRVLDASTAQDALDATEGRPAPDVAVIDIGLPDMDGFELLAALRERVGYDEMAAIFLSGRVEDEQIEHGRRLGATYLTKPFVASALLSAIERSYHEHEPTW